MTTTRNRSPRLSIGIPVYNGEAFIAQALDCLLAQTFDDFEIIISDNASTDHTQEICQAYAKRDPRVRYLRNPRNLGAIANFNRVFELATGPLFKWAAHDDLHHVTYLASAIRLLDEDPEVVLAHSGTGFIDENGELFPYSSSIGSYIDPKTTVRVVPDSPDIGNNAIAVKRFWQVLARARWATHMFGVIRRASLQQTRLMPNFAGGDRVMLAELALLGRFQCNPERLFLKRFHANVSWALNQRELRDFLSPDDKAYWRRARQLEAFFSASRHKPIGTLGKSICAAMVAAHSARTAFQAMARKDARNSALGLVWRDSPSN